jgi:isopenicillin-N epimerase
VALPLGEEHVEEIWSGVTDRTRVLFVSHVTSETAVQLSVQELCARARERGITTIVDGAHGPAHVPLELAELGADYYAGNCHKWLLAPKGAGFLYVRRELQRDVHPLVIGWGYEDASTFLTRHQKQGTRDPSAFLTVPTAIEWQREHDDVRAQCRERVGRIPERLGLPALGSGLQMVSMRLPKDAPGDLQERLYDDYRIEIPVFAGGIIRASIQAYNDDTDVEALAEALESLLVIRAEA